MTTSLLIKILTWTRDIDHTHISQEPASPNPMRRDAIGKGVQNGEDDVAVKFYAFCYGARDDGGGGACEGKLLEGET